MAELTLRLEQLSVGDELTGLTNRRGLAGAGADLLHVADEREADVQVLFVDVRALSDLNERLGHEAGDAALQAVARALRVAFRRSDVVARIGGTLFTVLALDLREDERDGVEKRIMEHLTNVETVRYVGDDIEVRLGWTHARPATRPRSRNSSGARPAHAARRPTEPAGRIPGVCGVGRKSQSERGPSLGRTRFVTSQPEAPARCSRAREANETDGSGEQ